MNSINSMLNCWTVLSPNGNIAFNVKLDEEGRIEYYISNKDQVIIEDSPMGIKTSISDFSVGVSFISLTEKRIKETYRMISGKKSVCESTANEIILSLKSKIHIMNIHIRTYNDGVAYRYSIPGEGPISISSEISAFRIPDTDIGWAHTFIEHYEGFYNLRTYEALLSGHYGMPVLLKNADCYALISEAAVYGAYCGCHLEGNKERGLLRVIFAPDQGNSVFSNRPFNTPWRVVVIGELRDIVETGIFENLNPASEIADISWIKPGRASWSWWSGDSTSNYAVQIRYVDFAARMGWEYYLCDGGWDKSWINALSAYAKTKNIGLFVWYHYKELETDDELLTILPWLSSIGVKGIKVDFFESDSQERICLYDKIAKIAALYKLMIVYHGCTKPSGERRKWPHIMTREGVLGAEYYKLPLDGPTAEHNCTVPFTRNVVGPMDYTPVTYSNNRGLTTWAHQTALSVVFESGIQHYADKPEYIESIGEAIEYLKLCPASWDDTKLIEGKPGRYVTIARRREERWFVGSLCGGDNSRVASIPLTFLKEGITYIADIYKDGDTQKDIVHSRNKVNRSMVMNVNLAVNGGCAMSLIPIKQD